MLRTGPGPRYKTSPRLIGMATSRPHTHLLTTPEPGAGVSNEENRVPVFESLWFPGAADSNPTALHCSMLHIHSQKCVHRAHTYDTDPRPHRVMWASPGKSYKRVLPGVLPGAHHLSAHSGPCTCELSREPVSPATANCSKEAHHHLSAHTRVSHSEPALILKTALPQVPQCHRGSRSPHLKLTLGPEQAQLLSHLLLWHRLPPNSRPLFVLPGVITHAPAPNTHTHGHTHTPH